jgi:hypothetical protein
MRHYTELECILAENEEAKKLSGFGGDEKGDDSVSLIDISKKPYRHLLHQNKLTEFDIRRYIFARQARVRSCQITTYISLVFHNC